MSRIDVERGDVRAFREVINERGKTATASHRKNHIYGRDEGFRRECEL